MKKRHQEELLNWAYVAVEQLEKLDNDRAARILKDGGKALIIEIEKEKAARCNEQQTAS